MELQSQNSNSNKEEFDPSQSDYFFVRMMAQVQQSFLKEKAEAASRGMQIRNVNGVPVKVLKILEDGEQWSHRKLAEDIGISAGTITSVLNKMFKRGEIELCKQIESKNSVTRFYKITKLGRSRIA